MSMAAATHSSVWSVTLASGDSSNAICSRLTLTRLANSACVIQAPTREA